MQIPHPSCPHSPSAPRGLVAATASLATLVPLRTYSLSGVDAKNAGEEEDGAEADAEGSTLPMNTW